MRFLTGLLAFPAVVLATGPPADQITISSVTHSGNGCPQGSVSSIFNNDKTIITLGFDQFQTYIGPGTSIQDRSKNCQIHLNLKYPSGFSFAVVDSVYHGFALLESGVTGDFLSTYYFSSDAASTCTTRTSIKGGGVWADGQVYTQQDFVPATSVIRSPCGGSSDILNINNRVALSSTKSSASGMISNDDATLALTQQINIKWYEC
ncbi:Secreted protein [Scedosporium apiospermum]|uniref:Secreted protein n=1 Tax=Pseudallescheria apiosperma TaxID=563466 RepID=A0A084G094_PSEDA|nr:Secreted protein [Scedosporium apiospermum]KEZ40756.1 Secreted protein [Scedosporium apiospermum]